MGTSITSRTKDQEKQFRRLTEDVAKHGADLALRQVRADRDGWQCVLRRGGEFKRAVAEIIVAKTRELVAANLYTDEEVRSSYTYSKEHKGPKPIEVQSEALAKICGLDPKHALAFAKNLPALESFVPENALPWVGWFAVISDSGLVKLFSQIADPALRHCLGIQLLHEKIAATRPFRNFREGQITPTHLRRHAITAEALERLAVMQTGDIWIIAAQLGMLHRGRSTRRACEVFTGNESGLDSLAGCSIALTHPERFVRFDELDMDLPGDEFSPDADGDFSDAPCFRFGDDGLEFGTYWIDDADGRCGSASAFSPQVGAAPCLPADGA